MKLITVKSHKRGKKSVKGYKRKSRPLGKEKIISAKPTMIYSVRDKSGQFKGWSTKSGKKLKK